MNLRDVVNQSTTSKAMFRFLSKRRRFRRETNIPYFQTVLEGDSVKVIPEELVHTFKQLAELGYGTLEGNYFFWSYDLKDVAKIAAGEMKLSDAKALAVFRKKPTLQMMSESDDNVISVRKSDIIKMVETLLANSVPGY